MDLKDGWIKIDFQWIKIQMFSKPLCVHYNPLNLKELLLLIK
jgi:hypothetical protein